MTGVCLKENIRNLTIKIWQWKRMAEELDCFLCKCAVQYVQKLDLFNEKTVPTGKSVNKEQ